MQLTPDSTNAGSTGDLIPAGTVAYATFRVQEMASSHKTGGSYAKAELTIATGQFTRRKVFVNNLMNPDDERNSAGAREMGSGAICRMLEALGVFVLSDPASYSRMNDFPAAVEAIQNITEQQGKLVAIKVGIEKGKDGYADKNVVAAYLSPNPKSSTHKDWQRLQTETGPQANAVPAPVAAVTSAGWTSPPKPSVLTPPAWAAPKPTPATAPVIDDEVPF